MHSPIQKSTAANRTLLRLIPTAGALVLGISLLKQSWGWARVPAFQPSFADLRIVTSTASCILEGTWSASGPTCDPLGRPFNYPIVWAKMFAVLRFDDSRTSLIGLLLGALVITVLTIPFLKLAVGLQPLWRIAIAFLCVVSPPVALQLERGNTDGMILILFAVVSALYGRLQRLSVSLATVGAALKLFPVVTVLAFVPQNRRERSMIGFLVGVPLLLVLSGESLVRLTEMQEPPGEFRFGSLLLLYHLLPAALNYPRLWVLAAGVSITVIPAVCLLRILRREIKGVSQVLGKIGPGSSLFLFGGLLFVGSFVSGSRYDYSQQFLVMAVLGIALSPVKSHLINALLWLAPASLWGAFWLSPESLVGDIATSLCAWIVLAVLIQSRLDVLKQLFTAKSG